MQSGRAAIAGVSAAFMALALAACGGSSNSSSSSSGPLIARTLSPVTATSTPGADFEFGDLAAERQLAARGPAWTALNGVGVSYFASDPNGTQDGLNLATGSVGLVIGVPPHEAAMISGPGVNGPKVKAAVIKLGAKPATVAGRSGVVWGAEGTFHLNAVNALGVGPGEGQFDRAVFEPDAVFAARYTADLQRLFGIGGKTLGADPLTQATLNCLGDAVAAVGVAGQGQSAGSELAAGVLRTQTATPHEVLCEVPPAADVTATEKLVRSLYGPHPPTLPKGASLKSTASSVAVSTGSAGGRTWVRAIVVDKPMAQATSLINLVERNILQP